jgi:hypothetical protein
VRFTPNRRWSGAALCLLGLMLAQCSHNPPSADGAITGIAHPCVGPASLALSQQYVQHLPVTVLLNQGSRLVAHLTVRGAHTYRFVVPAGDYVVTTHQGDGPNHISVTVHPGQAALANIPSNCD